MTRARYESLAGRATIITGGASGIGEAMVRGFVRNGARVAFLDMAADAGRALASETGALFLECDLRDIAALRTAIVGAEAAHGPCRALVNNAARDDRYDFDSLTLEQFDESLTGNFRHVVFACQAVLPGMRAAGGGAIVNMSSVAWMGGGQRMQTYAASKAAIVGFTNSLARDVGPHRIRVNAIAPGMVITERQRRLWFQDESQIETFRQRQCLPDLIAVDDVADLALFLAADDSRSITKQCFVINAGSR